MGGALSDRLSAALWAVVPANALCAVVPANALCAVVPAKAGTHIPEPVVMGPRFREDDSVDQSDLA